MASCRIHFPYPSGRLCGRIPHTTPLADRCLQYILLFLHRSRRVLLPFGSTYISHCTLGITAGYHRLWAHRCYNASRPLQYILALAGAGAIQGSIKWWSRDHRAHHRYTDTDLDPYNAHRGLYWSHVGWIMTKPRTRPGMADVADLKNNDIVQWQHKYFVWCLLSMGFVLPAIIPWIFWGDLQGGIIYAAILRLVLVHHVRTSSSIISYF